MKRVIMLIRIMYMEAFYVWGARAYERAQRGFQYPEDSLYYASAELNQAWGDLLMAMGDSFAPADGRE